jgi:hypothetical protein
LILVDSLYINSSGGKNLLEYFINTLLENKLIDDYVFIVDSRLNSETLNSINVGNIFVSNPSEFNRYFTYKNILSKFNIKSVFCFSNIPPSVFLKIDCGVFIYFHNILLLNSSFSNYTFYQRAILNLKALYIACNSKSRYKFIVQTSLMKKCFRDHLFFKTFKVDILPFFDESNLLKSFKNKFWQYFYPADGVPQKNHKLLFSVWEELCYYGIFPKLIVTIDSYKYPDLGSDIQRLKFLGAKIINLGFVKKKLVLEYLNKSKYLLFPSLNESFGLPLVEGAILGCHIITPDLEYVEDIIYTNAKYNSIKNDLFDLIYKIETNEFKTDKPIIKVENKIQLLIKLINYNHV